MFSLLTGRGECLWINVFLSFEALWRVSVFFFWTFNIDVVILFLTVLSLLSFSLFIILCRLPTPSTFDMVIPANAVGRVMGKGGANIANIRKVGNLFLTLCLYGHFVCS